MLCTDPRHVPLALRWVSVMEFAWRCRDIPLPPPLHATPCQMLVAEARFLVPSSTEEGVPPSSLGPTDSELSVTAADAILKAIGAWKCSACVFVCVLCVWVCACARACPTPPHPTPLPVHQPIPAPVLLLARCAH